MELLALRCKTLAGFYMMLAGYVNAIGDSIVEGMDCFTPFAMTMGTG